MASTRNLLERIQGSLDESMGVRSQELRPQLSPVPSPKDAGRRPLRNVGRVDINQVMPDPDQPRTEFSEDAIDRLAASIRDKGQLMAIRVRWSDVHGKWIIIAGERRWRATKRAGLPTIDAYFHDGDVSQTEILEQQLIENLLREDLKPVEEARAFQRLMELNEWNGKQVAEALRVPASHVSRSLALLKLPPDIQHQVDAGEISARAAYELSKLDNDGMRQQLAEQAAAGKLTHDQTAKAVRQRRGKPREKSRGTSLKFITELGWTISARSMRKGSYAELEQSLVEVLAEVRHRISNNSEIL